MIIKPTIFLSWIGVLVFSQLADAQATKASNAHLAQADRSVLDRIDIDEHDRDPNEIIAQAVESGAIGAELGRSEAIFEMFAREGLVIRLKIYPPSGAYRDDYSRLACGARDRRAMWLFFHWFAHIQLDQKRGVTGYDLGKAVAEHERYGDRVYDYDRPPTPPFASYRYEQQAAILSDYAMLKRCGDARGWLPQYEKVVRPFLN